MPDLIILWYGNREEVIESNFLKFSEYLIHKNSYSMLSEEAI